MTANPFETHGIGHLSASSINTWINAPSAWFLDKVMGCRGGVGCAAYRGTATEAGVSAGLFDQAMSVEDCVAVSLPIYDRLAAFSTDSKRETERAGVPGMVAQGLALRGHGVPIRPNTGDQHRIEITVEGLSVPIIGYLDWLYPNEIIDLKTTFRVPSAMADNHLRQAAIYKTAYMDRRVRFFYTSDKKAACHTLDRDGYDHAMIQVRQAALRLQRFLSVSSDPAELAGLVSHNPDTFYFNDPATRAKALEVFGF